MSMRGIVLCAAIAVPCFSAMGSTSVLADKGPSGCAAVASSGENSGSRDVQLLSIADAVARSMAQLTPAWYALVGTTEAEVSQARTAGMTAADKNGDGLVCSTLLWGDQLNPNAKWAQIYADYLSNPTQVEAFRITDNHTGR